MRIGESGGFCLVKHCVEGNPVRYCGRCQRLVDVVLVSRGERVSYEVIPVDIEV
jgi:hypothetical protein